MNTTTIFFDSLRKKKTIYIREEADGRTSPCSSIRYFEFQHQPTLRTTSRLTTHIRTVNISYGLQYKPPLTTINSPRRKPPTPTTTPTGEQHSDQRPSSFRIFCRLITVNPTSGQMFLLTVRFYI